MTEVPSNALPFFALFWPLALACAIVLPFMQRHAIRLLPLAPLPAMLFALTGQQDPAFLPDLLLSAELTMVPEGRLLLAMTAVLWFFAALYAQAYMQTARKPAVFAGFWCVTLAGNVGVFLAADVVTFYVAFAAVSLASYVLIVHEANEAALRAGRIYIVMVIFGEVSLLAAFVIGIAAADSLNIAEIRAALPSAPLGDLASLLLVVGFGIKAGVMPLHIWLPLAHPAAPTPASAILSGAIVKAGIIGMILFLPVGHGFSNWLVALGFAGTFAGAFLGLRETNPKTILAYSTISQMSLVTALIGASAGDGEASALIAFYALHHGLAKGALFLSVGLVIACSGRWHSAMISVIAIVALSIAGAPLTGGSVVKLAAKSGLHGATETALTLSAITTTLLLAWFIMRLANAEPDEKAGHPSVFLTGPTLALGLAALIVPWLLGPVWSGLTPGYTLQLSSLWSSAWPVATGLTASILWSWRRRHVTPASVRTVAECVDDRLAVVRKQPAWTAIQITRIASARIAAATQTAILAVVTVTFAMDRRLRRGDYASVLLIAFCIAIALGGRLWQ